MQATEIGLYQVVTIFIILTILISIFSFAVAFALQKKLRLKEKALYEEMLSIQEAEQIRIGRDLHDQTSPFLSAIQFEIDTNKMNVGENFTRLLTETVNSVRYASHNLSPPGLLDVGLEFSLNKLIKHAYAHSGIKFTLTCQPTGLKLSEKISLHAYRIVSELSSNAVKHSGAKYISIEIKASNTTLMIKVSDDGKGMDLETTIYSDGLGWQSINSRIAVLMAEKSIITGDKGTSINISIPINS